MFKDRILRPPRLCWNKITIHLNKLGVLLKIEIFWDESRNLIITMHINEVINWKIRINGVERIAVSS